MRRIRRVGAMVFAICSPFRSRQRRSPTPEVGPGATTDARVISHRHRRLEAATTNGTSSPGSPALCGRGAPTFFTTTLSLTR
jgi:hypothetical protein